MREVVITGVGAVTPLGVGARTLHERWTAGACADRGRRGAVRRLRPAGAAVRARRRAAPIASRSSRSPPPTRRWPTRAGMPTSRPYRSSGRAACSGPASAASGRSRPTTRACCAKGPDAVSPLAVPLMMSNAGSAALAMRHGLLGPTCGLVSACAAGAHAIGAAARTIQAGDADVVSRRRLGGGADAARPRPRSPRSTPSRRRASRARSTRAATASSWARAPACSCSRTPSTAAARGARVLGEHRRLRRDLRRPPPDGARPGGRRRGARDRAALADAGIDAGGRRLRQRARHLDAAQRPRRDDGAQGRARRARVRAAGLVDEVGDRPPARRRRRRRGGRDAARAARPRRAADARLRSSPTRASTSTTCRARRARCACPTAARRVGLSNSFGFGGHNAVLVLEAGAA